MRVPIVPSPDFAEALQSELELRAPAVFDLPLVAELGHFVLDRPVMPLEQKIEVRLHEPEVLLEEGADPQLVAFGPIVRPLELHQEAHVDEVLPRLANLELVLPLDRIEARRLGTAAVVPRIDLGRPPR